MKTRKKLAALCMILVLGLSCLVYGNSIHSYAASTQFSISLSSSSIQKGGSVTVTVSISCSEALGAYSYCLSYDSSLLEYQSGATAEVEPYPVPDMAMEILLLLPTALHFLL